MLVLITYDVNTENKEGKTRLRKVAKICKNYGQRVQNSVFECVIESAQYSYLKSQLTEIIDKDIDSIRFYSMGNSYKNRIEHIGKENTLQQDKILIF